MVRVKYCNTISKYSGIQAFKHSSIQAFKHSGIQAFKHLGKAGSTEDEFQGPISIQNVADFY